MSYQNISEELVTMAQKNWAVLAVVSIIFLVCFIRYVTKNGKSRKLPKSLPGEKLFKSGMSLGKTSRKKKGKKQRSIEGVGTDTKKSTTLTRSLENITKKSEKKKNKAKKKKSSQHDGFSEVTDTITEADDGGEWQVVSTKVQRQAKKERKQRSETSEFGGGDFVTTTTNRGISNVMNNPSPPSSFQSFSFPSTAKDVAPRFARAAGEEWKENRPKRRTSPSMSPQRITPPSTQSLLQRNHITSSNVIESMETSMPPLNRWHKEVPVTNNTSNNMSGDSWSFQPQLLLQQNLPPLPNPTIPLNVAYAGLKTTEQFLHSPWSPMITTATTNIGPNWMSNNGDNSPSSTAAASWPNQTNTNNNTTSPYHDIITSAVLSSASTTWSDNGATPATAGSPPSSHCLRSGKQETVKSSINNGGDSWSTTSSALHHHHHHHNPVDLNAAPNHHHHHQNGLGGIWNQYQPPLPSVYNTFGVFPTTDWHLVAPSAFDATTNGNSVQPVSNLLTSNVPTTQQLLTCATDNVGVTQENFPSHHHDDEVEEEIVEEADPWNIDPEQPATTDDQNADWSAPDVNWSNAANDDWQAPPAPVKPAPTYFDDSSDDFVSSGIRQVSSSTTDLSSTSAGNNKKSRRRRRKKQSEMVTDVEKQQTSSPPPPPSIVDTATTVAEVVMKQQEVITSQLDASSAAAVTVGTESDGEWTTPSLLKKRRSRARKED